MVARTSGSTVTILGDVWRCCLRRRRRGGLSSSLLIDLRFTDKKGAERAKGAEGTRLLRFPRARALPKKSLTDNGSCTQIMAEDEEGRGKRDAKGQKTEVAGSAEYGLPLLRSQQPARSEHFKPGERASDSPRVSYFTRVPNSHVLLLAPKIVIPSPAIPPSAPFSLGSPIRDFHLAPQPAGGRAPL